MEERTFINSQVANIVKITPRQAASWDEKGVIDAFRESSGTGTRREYNFVNLLEFGLCKELFSMGLGFRLIKTMVSELRGKGILKAWSKDMGGYYERQKMLDMELYAKFISTIKKNSLMIRDSDKISEWLAENFINMVGPDLEHAVLIYFFGDGMNILDVDIYPWEMDYIIRFSEIRGKFVNCKTSILVDLGKIRNEIAQGL